MFYGAHKKKLESDCDLSTTMRRKKRNQQTKSDILRVFHGRINAKKWKLCFVERSNNGRDKLESKNTPEPYLKKKPSKFEEKIRWKNDGRKMHEFISMCKERFVYALLCTKLNFLVNKWNHRHGHNKSFHIKIQPTLNGTCSQKKTNHRAECCPRDKPYIPFVRWLLFYPVSIIEAKITIHNVYHDHDCL